MSRRRKLWRGLVVLVTVAILGVVLVAVLFPRQAMRDRLVAELEAATGAEVVLGEANLQVFPGLGLKLGQGSITGTGAALTARTGSPNEIGNYHLDLESFTVSVAFWPLLGRNLRIEAIDVDANELLLETPEDRIVVRDFRLAIRDFGLNLERASVPGADPEERIPPGQLIPEDLFLAFEGSAGELVVQSEVYTELVFAGEVIGPLIEVTSLDCRRDAGTITGSLTLDFERDPWGEAIFEVRAVAVPAAALLETWAPDIAQRLASDLDAEVSGSCSLKDGDTALATLNLVGAMNAGEGTLHAADWLQEVSPYLGNRQDLKDVSFTSLEHAFRVEKGHYLIDGLIIDGRETDWLGQGWISFDNRLDLKFKVKLPPGFKPDLGQWSFLATTLMDDEGRVNLAFGLAGDSRRPKVALDLGNLKSLLD